MRRTFFALGVTAVVVAILGAATSATSRAGPPPPLFYYSRFSLTPPTAGRAFTAILVGHPNDVAWSLSCSVSLRGHLIAAHRQDFGRQTGSAAPTGFDWRTCGFRVPPGTAGDALTVAVNGSDSNGHTFGGAQHWTIVKHAIMKPVPLGPYPPASFADFFSETSPIAGRAFTAVVVELTDGGAWRLRCSATLRGHSIVAHRQEFNALPDFRTCGFDLPRGSTGKSLTVTADVTAPDGQSLHVNRGWRIVGS